MLIAPPSQIELTLSPAMPEIAAARLGHGRGSGDVMPAEFTVGADPHPAAVGKSANASPESFKRFEAMVLQTFIQNMLPKEGAAVYGKGMAGDMWKSLLAENLAEVMAERGGIGIADRLLGEHYTAPATSAVPATGSETTAPESAIAVERLTIAPTVLDGMQRSLSGLLDDEPVPSPRAATQFAMKRG